MKITNTKKISQTPAELTIKTTSLKKALEEYPKNGGFLLAGHEQVVMETPARGKILCNVTLNITVQRTEKT